MLIYRKNATEYFIMENRQRAGRDAALPAAGLAIWHVDQLGSNNEEQMTPGKHYECSLEQADHRFDLGRGVNGGDAGDLFGDPGARSIGSVTLPDSKWWDGGSSGLELAQISAPAPTMTGPGENGNIDVHLREVDGRFDKWYDAAAAVKKEILATSLTAISASLRVSCYFTTTDDCGTINRLFVAR